MMTSSNKITEFLIILDKVKFKDRPITLIGDLPFYQSTGDNSGQKETWFPFMGIGEKGELARNFLKPGTSFTDKNMKLVFPEDVITELNRLSLEISNLPETIKRFGNFECLCLSMIIGDGFWQTPDGKKISLFLKNNYADLLSNYENKFELKLKAIRNLDVTNINVQAYRANDSIMPILVNLWLETQGARRDSVSRLGPWINLDYANCTMLNNLGVNISSLIVTLVDRVNQHIITLGNRILDEEKSIFYTNKKNIDIWKHKIYVLNEVKYFLRDGKTNELDAAMKTYPKYNKGMGTSTVEKLIEEAKNTKLSEVKRYGKSALPR